MEKMFRYPGSKPFTIEYKDLFYGRDTDINDLCKFIKTEKLTILYGKSGLGKSSLLNVGVIPRFESEYEFFYIPVRFGSYSDYNRTTPVEIFLEKVKLAKTSDTFLNEIENKTFRFGNISKICNCNFLIKKDFC